MLLLTLTLAAALAALLLLLWRRPGVEAYKAQQKECAKRKKSKKFFDETRGQGGKCMSEWNEKGDRRNCEGRIVGGRCVVTKKVKPRTCRDGYTWNPYKQTCIKPRDASQTSQTKRKDTASKTSDKTTGKKDTTDKTAGKKTKKKSDKTESDASVEKKGKKDKDDEAPAKKGTPGAGDCSTTMTQNSDGKDPASCFTLVRSCDRVVNKQLPRGLSGDDWEKVCVAKRGAGRGACHHVESGEIRAWKSNRQGQGCKREKGDYTKYHFSRGGREIVRGTVGNVN